MVALDRRLWALPIAHSTFEIGHWPALYMVGDMTRKLDFGIVRLDETTALVLDRNKDRTLIDGEITCDCLLGNSYTRFVTTGERVATGLLATAHVTCLCMRYCPGSFHVFGNFRIRMLDPPITSS